MLIGGDIKDFYLKYYLKCVKEIVVLKFVFFNYLLRFLYDGWFNLVKY